MASYEGHVSEIQDPCGIKIATHSTCSRMCKGDACRGEGPPHARTMTPTALQGNSVSCQAARQAAASLRPRECTCPKPCWVLMLLQEELLVADPENGIILPNPQPIFPNGTVPEAPPHHGWMYPYTTMPHYHSQNAGPWCGIPFWLHQAPPFFLSVHHLLFSQ